MDINTVKYIKNMENNNLKQVVISAILGDGSIIPSGAISISSINKDYLEFKKGLCGSFAGSVTTRMNHGFKIAPIHTLHLRASGFSKNLVHATASEVVEEIDELGLAMWFFDDGSRHKTANFYNLCTHSFSREEEEKVLIPALNKWGIYPKVFTENKRDGRVFTYLNVTKYSGGYIINNILKKYMVKGFEYKTFDCPLEGNFNILKEKFKGKCITSFGLQGLLEKEDFKELVETMIITEQEVVTFERNRGKVFKESGLIKL